MAMPSAYKMFNGLFLAEAVFSRNISAILPVLQGLQYHIIAIKP
jgi:hypothetical protein